MRRRILNLDQRPQQPPTSNSSEGTQSVYIEDKNHFYSIQHVQTHNHSNILALNSDQLAIKDRMITELSIDNCRLKEDLAKTHYQRF
jgi:hypothetical protein